MGGGRYDPNAFRSYASTQDFDHKTPDQVINRRGVKAEFLPKNFKNGIRESRDSTDNPRSTPIIIAGDGTGSMGKYAGLLIKEGLNAFVEALYKTRVVSDPHVMGMIVGDARCDMVPIQCTQFEADIRIIEQFQDLYIEGRGGGNSTESYSLPWVVASTMLHTDAWEARREKGILFTYGDEDAPHTLTPTQLQDVLGLHVEKSVTPEQALRAVSQMYDVFHLVIEEGSGSGNGFDYTYKTWRELMGERVIPVPDYRRVSDIMLKVVEDREAYRTSDTAQGTGVVHTPSGAVATNKGSAAAQAVRIR